MKKAQALGYISQDLHDHLSVRFGGYTMSFGKFLTKAIQRSACRVNLPR